VYFNLFSFKYQLNANTTRTIVQPVNTAACIGNTLPHSGN